MAGGGGSEEDGDMEMSWLRDQHQYCIIAVFEIWTSAHHKRQAHYIRYLAIHDVRPYQRSGRLFCLGHWKHTHS
jgi:hypothetical protein